MNELLQFTASLQAQLSSEFITSIIAMSYLLVVAAEIGDKSQIVCMVLAARYRAAPVAFGAIAAFILLNSLAVTVGITINQLIDPKYINLTVALMFLAFGVQGLMNSQDDEEPEQAKIYSAKRLLLTTFVLITVAEFGDKTQLAIVALSSSQPPFSIWLGATLALITTSLLGVWAGRTLLQRIPLAILHRVSGALFVILGLAAGYRAYQLFTI